MKLFDKNKAVETYFQIFEQVVNSGDLMKR